MDRNTLNEILKILPDDFGFKAVYEENEVPKDCEVLILGIGKHKIEFTNGKYRPKNNDELKALCDIDSIELDDIDPSKVTDMSRIFDGSNRKDFSGIESWNVSNVVNMYGMFYCNRWFNADISGWNVENVEDMENMFCGTEQFCHSLNEWSINNQVNIQGIFADTNYPKKYIKSWREKVGEEMFDKAFIKRVWQRK